jgi:hypothetical protein
VESLTACSLVFMPPLVRPIRRPLWSSGPPFRPQAGRGAVRLLACRIDHDRLPNGGLGGPYSLGASRQRKPLRLMKIMWLSTGRSSTRGLPWLLGKKGFSHATCAAVSQRKLLIDRSFCGGRTMQQRQVQWVLNLKNP